MWGQLFRIKREGLNNWSSIYTLARHAHWKSDTRLRKAIQRRNCEVYNINTLLRIQIIGDPYYLSETTSFVYIDINQAGRDNFNNDTFHATSIGQSLYVFPSMLSWRGQGRVQTKRKIIRFWWINVLAPPPPPWGSSMKKISSTMDFCRKNPAYGRQSISRPMRIVAPMPQEGGPRIPQNPNFLKNGKNHQKRKNSKTSRNMPILATRPSTRGL